MVELRKIEVKHEVIASDNYTAPMAKTISQLNDVRAILRSFGAMGYDIETKVHYGNLSARIDSRFICTATQTSGLSFLEMAQYPIVEGLKGSIVHSKGLDARALPSVECTTHDGLYKCNQRIKCVAHGHMQLLYDYYRERESEAVVIGEEVSYGSMELRERVIAEGGNPALLCHHSPHGNWGTLVPLGHFNSFFIAGESIPAVRQGFLESLANAALYLVDRAEEGLTLCEVLDSE